MKCALMGAFRGGVGELVPPQKNKRKSQEVMLEVSGVDVESVLFEQGQAGHGL